MTLNELRKKIGISGLVVTLLIAMLMMMWFGYQLALYHIAQGERQQHAETVTLDIVEAENQRLKTQLNQRLAELELTNIELDQSIAALSEKEQELAGLREQLGFYQRVMAPEMTQDGFFVDDVSVSEAASPDHFRLRFVLLQQRNNKAVIKGELRVSVTGSLEGEPHTFTAGDPAFLPDGPIVYRFKFFQRVNTRFVLPANFEPESIHFSTTVYQYTTRRGDYEKSLPWRDAFSASPVAR